MHAESFVTMKSASAPPEAAGIATLRGMGGAFPYDTGERDRRGWDLQWRFAQSLHRDA
jgi:hypothetical protein